ncbi:MAG: PAS domain-containing protein, partial [Chlorobia bacterium]|nr:PAS domain-containing protein [Fimbriimonadaceae bacterium]
MVRPALPKRSELPRWSHYAIAIVLSALLVWLRVALTPLMGESAPFFLSSLSVMIAAFIGGVWPGLLATMLMTISGAFVVATPEMFENNVKMRLLLGGQLAMNVCISLICGALRSSEQVAEKSAIQERETLGHLDSLFKSITDAFVAVSHAMRLTSFNPAAAKLWELTEESLGKPIADVLPTTIMFAVNAPWEKALELNESVTVEIDVPSTKVSFEVRTFPGPAGLLVYFHDITERVESSEEIAELAIKQERANAFLDSLLTHAPVGFAFFDREYRCERVNKELPAITGIAASDLIGKPLREVFPDLAENIETFIDHVFETGKAVDQLEVLANNPLRPGKPFYWHTALYPVTSASGTVDSVGVVFIEVTRRKEIEDQLRESESRFRDVADNAPVMIWVCNPDGSSNWFNKPWLDFRQVSLDDAICEGCFANTHPDDEPWVNEAHREAFQLGEPFSIEYRTKDGGNEYRWLHVKGNPVFGPDGKVSSFLMSSIDVTDRMGMEENLRRSLANERSARGEAEEANRMKDEFLAGLSHELRTPLTTMLGWTELLMRPKVREAELIEGLQVIQKSSKLQLQLINDLLDMSRINVGKINLELEYAELTDAVLSTVDLVRTSAEEKKIALNFTAPATPIIVRIDADRFTQILWNLLSNAIKFTPVNGNVNVDIAADSENANISVTDTGVGIEATFLPYVFDRFRQEDATRSRRHGGLGLGLAIAKQLIELHGGNIAVKSDGPGTGCKITLSIPISEGMNLQPKIHPSRINSDVDDERRLVDVCILLVEDDTMSRQILKRILEAEGALVIPASSAPMARKLIRETTPEVMISDIGLPDEDGYQLIRSIRGVTG